MREEYYIPGSVREIFTDECAEYRIINYAKDMEMDNVEAMTHFIESVDIPKENIVYSDGTQITLVHKDFPRTVIVIDCGGLGDFFSHGYDVTCMSFDEYLEGVEEKDKILKELTACF